MATPRLTAGQIPRASFNGALAAALLLSTVIHAAAFYTAEWWGGLRPASYLVCPTNCPETDRRVEVTLPAPPKPPPPKRPEPKPEPAVVVERPEPARPPAAPKAGRVVLPDEALAPAKSPQADITLDRPALPKEVVVSESEAQTPPIASAEIFERIDRLTPGAPGEFGLGGTGTAVGIGPFGTDPEGSGTAGDGRRAPVQAPPPAPEPAPKGPTRPPQVVNWTDPPYPEQARQQGVEGTVVVRLLVTERGGPEDVRVSRSSGHAALDQAAVAHVRRARFSPALKDGQSVPMAITFRVRFRLVST